MSNIMGSDTANTWSDWMEKLQTTKIRSVRRAKQYVHIDVTDTGIAFDLEPAGVVFEVSVDQARQILIDLTAMLRRCDCDD